MTDFYSVLPGIQPSQGDILEAEYLAKQILEAKFPTLDLREGTGLRDAVIRPTATLLAMIKKGLDYHFEQNTISGVDDTTSTDMVDKIMSNLFVQRNPGTKSIVNARLFFARAKNIGIPSSTFFSIDNKIKFFPTQAYNLPSSYLQYDSYSNEYFTDVDLTAESEGVNYNVSSGSLLYFSNFDPYFLRGEINYLVSTSTPTETNTQFIARSKSSVSTRNLINQPSVDFNLRELFTSLKHVLTIGMGDSSMMRDLLLGMLPQRAARLAEAVSVVGTVATITVTNHKLFPGQYITSSGASSININGEFKINATTTNTISVTVPSGTAVPVTLPSIQEHPIQTRIHVGGAVDVYCSNSPVAELVQLSTDSSGVALLTGPNYKLTRSNIPVGVEDTIPLLNSVNVTSPNIVFSINTPTSGTATCTITSNGHPFIVGEVLAISGSVQQRSISSITCSGVTVTATSNGHGFLPGETVIVSGVTPADYNGTFIILSTTTNTFSYVVLASIASVGIGTMLCEVNVLNGSRTVQASTTNTFSVLTSNPKTTNTGTATITSPVRYTVSNENVEYRTPVSVTNLGDGTVSILLPRHGLQTSRKVTLSGLTPSGFNGSWVIGSVTDQDNFVVSVPTMTGIITSITTSSPVCTSTYPSSDFGFSTKQELSVDFGSAYPNRTATFEIRRFDNLDVVQNYLDNRDKRVLCANYLARGFNIYILSMSITQYTQSSNTSVTAAAQSYLDSLAPGQPFVVAELISSLKNAGMLDIKLPVSISYTRHTRDLTEINTPDTGVITDVLDPNDPTSLFILDNISTTVEYLPTTSAPVKR
jgi:hypothetical protein